MTSSALLSRGGADPADADPQLRALSQAAAEAPGWRGAALRALDAAAVPIAPGALLSQDDAARLAAEDPAMLGALARALPESAATLTVTLSPEKPSGDLVKARSAPWTSRDDAVSAAARLAAEVLEQWAAPRAQRRRRLARIGDAVALIIQARPEMAALAERARLYDLKTGGRETGGTLRPPPNAGRPDDAEPLGAPRSPDRAALHDAATAALEAAETALGAPLQADIALIASGESAPQTVRAALLSAAPLRPSAPAELRIAVEMAEAGRIDRIDALMAVAPDSLETLLHASIEPGAPRDCVAAGIAASPGAASGRLAFTAEAAEAMARDGDAAILVRMETTPEDVRGVAAAAGVLTTRGGLTSHAAVVARGLGAPCVVGAADVRLDLESETMRAADGREFAAGDWVTVDGSAGEALAGRLPLRQPEPTGAFATLMRWADAERRLGVRANADTPADAETARRLGVDGIGLCRTEHMFFEPERLTVMREMILADDAEDRRAVLARLLPMQRADFRRLFEIMGAGAERTGPPPVTIRLLDPPLHEFLPQDARALAQLAAAMGEPEAKLARRAVELREFNPMLGKRGCRLGVAYPEIYEMQARAIFEAALDVADAAGAAPAPEIMVPLVTAVRELELLKGRIEAVAALVARERGVRLEALRYGVGIMVETPRAALRANALGSLSSFFSFGTNDLTQMTYGLSRDDAGPLMRQYVERGVFEEDPFRNLDQEGVGELIRLAVDRGRAANPDILMGLCGEHGAAPAAIAFCESIRMDYVSCSPYRAPIARLAAAQASIRERRAEAAARPSAGAANESAKGSAGSAGP